MLTREVSLFGNPSVLDGSSLRVLDLKNREWERYGGVPVKHRLFALSLPGGEEPCFYTLSRVTDVLHWRAFLVENHQVRGQVSRGMP
jgi:hypothetical protein